MLQAFPCLTTTEFKEAAQNLESRSHDNLHGTKWLSVRWNANDDELIIHQTGHVGFPAANETTTTPNDERLSHRVEVTDVILEEGDDMDVVVRPVSSEERPAMTFSIVMSPTYQVPVLWFWLTDSLSMQSGDLEKIYNHVVASESIAALQSIGVMGGISMASHPVTDRPCFFVHPCNTHEALQAVRSPDSSPNPFEYLVLWLGVIGPAVGLYIPSKIVA